MAEWITPKTDWYGQTDSDGNYEGDRFNTEDFNRIKNNLAYLRELAVIMYPEFDINDLGEDRNKRQYFYADEINRLEENLKTIADKTFKMDIGTNPVFVDNGRLFNFDDLNRLEGLTLKLYDSLNNQHEGRQTLTFVLGIRRKGAF